MGGMVYTLLAIGFRDWFLIVAVPGPEEMVVSSGLFVAYFREGYRL